MRLLERAASFLGVQPGEGRTASLMLVHSFAMGTSTVFFETAASALFLERFGSGVLPWVYIAAAVVNTATGLGYTVLQARVAFDRLMLATLVALLAGVLGLRAGVFLGQAAWLFFGLLVFYRILSALTDLEYWAVAGRLYDVRQAKRLFGMIGSGEVVARVAGSFSVPLLVPATGVANLMLVSAAGLAGCLAVLVAIRREMGAGGGTPRREGAKARGGDGGLGKLLGSGYLVLLLSITFCAILAKYFVDYAFLERMKARYVEAAQLASFFGLFSGVTQVLSLATRLFVSGAVLGRFGIRFGLLTLPVAHAACTALLVLVGAMPGTGDAVFWLVMANQGIYKVFKHPIDNPSFKVLYQPLKPEQRLSAQIAVETILTPIATGLAGGVMLLFTVVIPYQPVRFAWAMLLTFAAWAAVAIRAGRAYPAALSEALKGRIVDEEFDFTDERSLATVKEALRSDKPGEVLFALELLEKAGHPELPVLLVELLDHAAAEVRSAALAHLERLRPAGCAVAVERLAGKDPSPAVRAAALRCLCAVGGEEATRRVAAFLEDPDPQIQRAALVGLLRAERELGGSFAARHLATLAGSSRPEKRVWAAQVVADVGRGGLTGVLERLLEDGFPAVRRAALVAAAKVGDPELWPRVARSLGDRAFAGVASLALAAGGEATLPALEAAWDRDEGAHVRAAIARLWGRIGGARARELLRARMGFPDERVRHEVLLGLRAVGYRATGDGEAAAVDRVAAEAEDAAWTLATLRDVEGEPGLGLVESALHLQLHGSRERILLLLSFLYDETAIVRARDNLGHVAKEKRAYALEILDVTLSHELKELVLPLCEELAPAERVRRLEEHLPQETLSRDERLRGILSRADEWITPWTRACAVHAVGTMGFADLGRDLAPLARAGAHPLVRETAGWALSRLGPGSGEGGRKGMLTVEKVIILKAVPMFEKTSEEVLADVAAILEEVEVKAGETIFEKGEVGDSLYVIVEGQVRVFDGEHTITQLGERDIFGELALLDPEPRLFSVAAVADAKLLRLDREAFSELMAGNIEIVRGVLRVLCERLRKASA